MSTKRATRASIWFCLAFCLAIYVLVSASLAVATADVCDGTLHGQKTWQFVPPRWECPSR
jgi:Na+(H+)/acetate symporter ActP